MITSIEQQIFRLKHEFEVVKWESFKGNRDAKLAWVAHLFRGGPPNPL
jgi:hypothetical protein